VIQPDQFFAAFVGLVLEAHAAERERSGDGLERGLGDGDADRAVRPFAAEDGAVTSPIA
jgi:hypothetical protein